jgi:hypothetical protein
MNTTTETRRYARNVPDEILSRAARRQLQQQQRKKGVVIAFAAASVVVLAAVGAAFALAGGDDNPPEHVANTRATSTTTATGASPSTTTATTAAAVTTPIPKSNNPIVALAQQYEGRYVGTFTNTTFDTSGPVTLDLHVDPATGVMKVHATFDGDLFGGGAKAVRVIDGSATLGGDPNAAISTNTKSFGPVIGRLQGVSELVLTAPDVPDRKVKSFELIGRIKPDYTGFDSTFTVVFENGDTATGTTSISCAPEGQRTSEVRTLCSIS